MPPPRPPARRARQVSGPAGVLEALPARVHWLLLCGRFRHQHSLPLPLQDGGAAAQPVGGPQALPPRAAGAALLPLHSGAHALAAHCMRGDPSVGSPCLQAPPLPLPPPRSLRRPQVDPGHGQSILGLAQLEARAGNASTALQLYQQGLQRQPRNVFLLSSLAQLQAQVGAAPLAGGPCMSPCNWPRWAAGPSSVLMRAVPPCGRCRLVSAASSDARKSCSLFPACLPPPGEAARGGAGHLEESGGPGPL